jgi:hypothetical protein
MVDHDENANNLALKAAGEALISRLRQAFPRFERAWNEYIASCCGDSDGPYLDVNAFAHFLDEELFGNGREDEVRRALFLLDRLFIESDEPTRDLIGIGVIEDFQTYASHRQNGYSKVIPLLPSTLLKVWAQIERQ